MNPANLSTHDGSGRSSLYSLGPRVILAKLSAQLWTRIVRQVSGFVLTIPDVKDVSGFVLTHPGIREISGLVSTTPLINRFVRS
jgi:hypothetical protein